MAVYSSPCVDAIRLYQDECVENVTKFWERNECNSENSLRIWRFLQVNKPENCYSQQEVQRFIERRMEEIQEDSPSLWAGKRYFYNIL